jgi:hypothetical protein
MHFAYFVYNFSSTANDFVGCMKTEFHLSYIYITVDFLHHREDTLLTIERQANDCYIEKQWLFIARITW